MSQAATASAPVPCGALRGAQVKEKQTAPELLAWARGPGLAAELGDAAGAAAALLRALLVAGAKSFTHMLIALERYHDALAPLLAEAGPEARARPPPRLAVPSRPRRPSASMPEGARLELGRSPPCDILAAMSC